MKEVDPIANSRLTAEWIVQHAVDIPWELLAGAEIDTNDGRSVLVRRVTMRPWPNGPLLEVVCADGIDGKSRNFNLKAFESGLLSVIRFSDQSPWTAQLVRLNTERAREARHAAEEVQTAKRDLVEINRKRTAELERKARAEALQEQLRMAEEARRRKEAHERELSRIALEEAWAKAAARREAIRQDIEIRSIERLCHYTRIRNLPTILKHGLLSRSKLAAIGCAVIQNDPERFDRRLNRISLSVTFPNYKLFYRCQRQDSHFPGGDQWVVLLISPNVCWNHDALFCKTNAASATVSNIHDEALSTPNAFAAMFDDQQSNHAREHRHLPPNFTWDPQAEVLVKDMIAPQEIMCIAFRDHASREDGRKLVAPMPESCKHIDFAMDPSLFKPRFDYEHWKNPFAKELQSLGNNWGGCPW